jgi:hypothetical protein
MLCLAGAQIMGGSQPAWRVPCCGPNESIRVGPLATVGGWGEARSVRSTG